MKKELITNKELQRLIALKTGKLNFEDVTEEDINKITEISLNSRLLNGKESGISLEILEIFPNLRELSISNYYVSQTEIDLIMSRQKLSKVTFMHSMFDKDISFKDKEHQIKEMSFLDCENVAFKIPDVDIVRATRTTIDFSKINLEKIKKIFVQEGKVINVQDTTNYPNIERINFDNSKLFDSEEKPKKDIKVSDKTDYSHTDGQLYDKLK